MIGIFYKLLWIFMLMLCAVNYSTAQSFNTLKKSPDAAFDATLNTLLNNNDVSGMTDYLKSNPQMVNNASSSKSEQGYGNKAIIHTVPLLYDAVRRTLQGTCYLDMCKVIIDAGCDLNAVFDGKPPVYIILDYIATHPAIQCETAEQLLSLIVSEKNFDVNYRYKTLLPPLPYLIRENHQFLGRYDKNYVSDNVLKLLIVKGSPINTYDNDGSSLMAFAIETDNQYLSAYFIKQGIDLKRSNNQGNDALYLAIDKGQLTIAKSVIEKTNFDLNINTLRNDPAVFKKYTDTYDYVADICANKAINYKDIRAFAEAFSDKFDLVRPKLDVIYNSEINKLEAAKLQAISIISNRENYSSVESIIQTNTAFINNFTSFYDPNEKKAVSDFVTLMTTTIKGLNLLEKLVNNPPGGYYTFKKIKQWENRIHEFFELGINEDWFSYACIENFQGWGDITAGTDAIRYIVNTYPEYAETFSSTKEYMTKHQLEIADAMAKEIVTCRAEAEEMTKDSKAEYYARMQRYQAERQQKCLQCDIDLDNKNNELPERVDYDNWLDQFLFSKNKPGVIYMKTGDKYKFYQNDDYSWEIETDWGFRGKDFKTFQEMISYFLKECEKKYCH